MPERTPPHDQEAERAVLGSMLVSQEASDGALSLLSESDFYRPINRRVFASMQSLAADLMPTDHLTVASRLDADTKTRAYLVELADNLPTSANWKHYAAIVRDHARRRAIIADASKAIASAFDSADPSSISSELSRSLEGIEPKSGRVVTMEQTIRDMDLTERVECFTTELLPNVFIERGSLVLLGARPSVGKSAMSLQIAEELASRHVRTRIYSHEMSRQQLARRSIQRHTGFDFPRQMRGLLPEEQETVRGAMGGDWARFLEIGDSNPSLRQVCSEIRRFARKGGSFVIIDHLHILVNGSDRGAVSEATRMLKLAANDASLNPAGGPDHRPVVFVLAQFSRLEKRDDGSFKEPTVQSFKESGTAEADADIAILLHQYDRKLDSRARDDLDSAGFILEFDWQKGTAPFKDLCLLEVAKQRNFKTGRYPMWFDKADQHFSLVDQKEGRE